jgi:hypothetical protein
MCKFVFTSEVAAEWWKALSSEPGFIQMPFVPISSRYEAMLHVPPYILADLNSELEKLKKEAERLQEKGNREALPEKEQRIEQLSHVIRLVTHLVDDLPGQLRAWDQLREAFRPRMVGNELARFMTGAEALTPDLIERLNTVTEIRRSLGQFIESPAGLMRDLDLTARRLSEAVVFDLQAWDSGNASATRAIWEAGSLARSRTIDPRVVDAMERTPETLFGQWVTDFNGVLDHWNGEGISGDRFRNITGAFDGFYRELGRLQTEFDKKSVAGHAEDLVRDLSRHARGLLNALEAEREDPGKANSYLGRLRSMMASVLAVSLSRVQAQVHEFGNPSFSELRARNAAAAPPGGAPNIAPGGAWVPAGPRGPAGAPRGGGNRGGPGRAGPPGDAPGAEPGRLEPEPVVVFHDEPGRLEPGPVVFGAEPGGLGAEPGRLGGDAVAPGGEHGLPGGEIHRPGGEHGPPGGEIHRPGGEHGPPGGEIHRPGELGGEFRRR